jgi:carboxyl-terminal processing protease
MPASTLLALAILAPVQEGPDLASGWTQFASAVRQTYYAKNKRHDEMEKNLNEAEPLAKKAKTKEELAQVIKTMIAKFGDSHFDFMTDEEQGFYMMDAIVRGEQANVMPNVGAWFKPAANGWEATMVMEGGPAAKAGVRKGDVITTVGAVPFSPVTPLRTFVGKEAQFQVMRNGKPITVSMTVASNNGLDMFMNGTRASAKIIERDGLKIGYLHVWTMVRDDFKQFFQNFVLNTARDTDAIVYDIRDGFGGRPEGFVDPFFMPAVNLNWIGETYNQNQQLGYGKPVMLVINGGSRSAKEVVAKTFKMSGRATLIGQPTIGHVLGTSPRPIGKWAYAEIPMVELEVNGEKLEKNPVRPDITVDQEIGADGTDLMMERAVSEAVKQVKASKG